MKPPIRTLIVLLPAVVIAFVIGRKTTSPASQPASSTHENSETGTATTWTCSMHPTIHQPDPGDCPICGMDLIPLVEDSTDPGPRSLSMSKSSLALADIQTSRVLREYPSSDVRLVGRLDYDETREKTLSARFPARIDELYVNYEGVRVDAGEHLARVYSPQLLSAQRELLTAHRSNPESSITRSAREKLRLWDLLPDQIDGILANGKASDTFDLKAPVGGVVVAKQVKEGDYLKTGQALFRIADLSVLWLQMAAYETDLPWLRFGQAVVFTVEAFPGEEFSGRIAFINPEVDRNTRTTRVRVNVPNPDGRLKPGMFARGSVTVRLAEGGSVYAPDFSGKWISPMHPEIVKDAPGDCDVCGMDLVPAATLGYIEDTDAIPPLVIPASAALRTGTRAVVYVKNSTADRPTFEGREVVLGVRAGDQILVSEGLKEGEELVTHGAFKIDSALQILAKPSMMNPAPEPEPVPSLELDRKTAIKLLPGYFALQAALASDNEGAAREAAKQMMHSSGHSGPLAALLHAMMDAGDLDTLRKPHFEILSNAIIRQASQHAADFSGLRIMHCPMVYDDRGADWLQKSEPLRNPYFGASMLNCGITKQTLGHDEAPTGEQ